MDEDLTRAKERAAALKAEFGDLVHPVTRRLDGVGREAEMVFKPVDADTFEAVFVGLSERGVRLRDEYRLKVGESRHEDLVVGTSHDGRHWNISQEPRFGVVDVPGEAPEVGVSEDMRIGDAVRAACLAYVDENGPSLVAAAVLKAAYAHVTTLSQVVTAREVVADQVKRASEKGAELDRRETELRDMTASTAPRP